MSSQSTKRTNPPASDTLTWTLTLSHSFRAWRSSCMFSLARSLCLGQEEEEPKSRAWDRHRAPELRSAAQALLRTSRDPRCLWRSLRYPLFSLLPGRSPVLRNSPPPPPWLPSSPAPAQSPQNHSCFLRNTFSGKSQNQTKRFCHLEHPTHSKPTPDCLLKEAQPLPLRHHALFCLLKTQHHWFRVYAENWMSQPLSQLVSCICLAGSFWIM